MAQLQNNIQLADSEREEGEIIDISENDLEDISSDEEFVLRERIAELEARNVELEKLASISAYSLEINTEHATITKGFLDTYGDDKVLHHQTTSYKTNSPDRGLRKPKQTTHNKHRTRSSANTSTRRLKRSPSYSRSSSTRINYINRKISSNKRVEKLRRNKRKKSTKKIRSKYSSSSSEDDMHLSREKLAAALGRTHKSTTSLLYCKLNMQSNVNLPKISSEEDDTVLKLRLEALQSKNSSKPSSPKLETRNSLSKRHHDEVSLEEQELRLIALKSAYVKKNEARKKRKLLACEQTTRPYSPTDDIQKIEGSEVVANEQGTDYSDNNMDISPIGSPNRVSLEDEYKSMDMEIAFSEENSASSICFVESLFASELSQLKSNLISPNNFNSAPDNFNSVHNNDNCLTAVSLTPVSNFEYIQYNRDSSNSNTMEIYVDKGNCCNDKQSNKPQNSDNSNVNSNFLNNETTVSNNELLICNNIQSDNNHISNLVSHTANIICNTNILNSNIKTKLAEAPLLIPLINETTELPKSESNNTQIKNDLSANTNKIKPRIDSQKSEESVADISLEADCLRSLLLSTLNKKSKAKSSQSLTNNANSKDNNEKKIAKNPQFLEAKISPLSSFQLLESAENNNKEISSSKTIPKLLKNITKETLKICDSNSLNQKKTVNSAVNSVSSSIKLNFPQKNVFPNRITNILNTDNTKKLKNSSPIPFESKLVPKLVIQLGNSDTDSESDNFDTNVKPPSKIDKENVEMEPAINNFDKKLDAYLKNVRTQVELSSLSPTKVTKNSINPVNTPLAVRHLPPSSQLEYKKLVNRMKLLEKQKTERTLKKPVDSRKSFNRLSPTNELPQKQVVIENEQLSKSNAISLKSNEENKTPIDINALYATLSDKKDEEISNVIGKMDENNQGLILKQTEKEYRDHSAIFLSELNYLIGIIQFAQTAKQKEVTIDKEINELREQLKIKESELNEQKKILTKNLFPKISMSHKKISKYRQKYSKVDKFCSHIGRVVKGNNYKLPMSKNAIIMDKLKTISAETKKLTNLNISKEKSENLIHANAKLKLDVESEKNEVLEDNSISTNKLIEPKNSTEISEDKNINNLFVMKQYKSPLEILKSSGQSLRDPNGVVCPFELSGKCEDSSCKYEHISK